MIQPYFQDGGVTIYHGDCFDVLPELKGIGAVLTDPPYSSGGAFRGDRMRQTVAKYVGSDTIAYRPDFAGDNRDQRSFLVWSSLWWMAAFKASVEGALVFCFTDWRQLPVTADALQVGGFIWRGVLPWVKGFGRPNPWGFSNSCEYVVWGSRGTLEDHQCQPGYFESPIERDKVHIAQKPASVLGWLVNAVPRGRLVVDPFMGSGSALFAARLRGCPAIGIDFDERYCEAAANRLRQVELFG